MENVILETIKEIVPKYRNSPSYLSVDEIKRLASESTGWFGKDTIWNSYTNTDHKMDKEDGRFDYDSPKFKQWDFESILFGFKSGIIFTKSGIVIIGYLYKNTDNLKSYKYPSFQKIDNDDYKVCYTLGLFNYEKFSNGNYYRILNSFDPYDGSNGYNYCNLFKDKLLFMTSLKRNNTEFKNYFFKHKDEIIKCKDSNFDFLEGESNIFVGKRIFRYGIGGNYLHKLNDDEIPFFKELIEKLEIKDRDRVRSENQSEKKRKTKFNKSQNSIISNLDKDKNGQLDLIELKNDFDQLVKKNQRKIIEIDRVYIQQFVKISNYQKQKRENLQIIFESISQTKDEKELTEQVELLKEQIHSYELIIFHSLKMVTCLVEDDMFTFYEIHESFDKLKMFTSNHEKEVSQKLKNIEGGIYKLILVTRQMEENIISELENMSYIQQQSFSELSDSISSQLKSIDSSINLDILVGSINAYQTYKLRKGN